MSLLEDIFLQDEAGEAQELERIIEGDEYDERPQRDSDSDDNSEKEDEAEEDKRRVDPASTKTKRVVKNPRFVLNPARLTGPRGIQVIPEHFKDFKFKGKGHEKEDLDLVLKKLEHWAYRLYPKFQFEDCLKKIETLGKKRPVMVHLHKIRSDQLTSEETVVQKDSSDDELAVPLPQEEDEFDKLLQQQIELARNTPAPGSVKKGGFETPSDKRSSLTMPKATSSPSISDEQKERMMRNRKLAEERRLARLKANSNNSPQNLTTVDLTEANRNETAVIDIEKQNTTNTQAKKNRSNVIDSSDEDNEVSVMEAVNVHVNSEDIEAETANNEIVRAKKNKSQLIDSSDDDEVSILRDDNGVDEDLDSNNDIVRAKKNKSQLIDSSDDDEVSVLRDDNGVYEHLNSKDADTKSVELRKKTNFVDSSDSDEENELTIMEDVIVDNTNLNGKDAHSKSVNKLINQRKNKSNLIDSSDDEASNGNEIDKKSKDNEVIDITEGYKNVNAHSKKNNIEIVDITEGYENKNTTIQNNEVIVIDSDKNNEKNTNIGLAIDSSDEECNISTVNESISADIHHQVDKNINKNREPVISEKDNTSANVNKVLQDPQTTSIQTSELMGSNNDKDARKESVTLNKENIDSNKIGDGIDELMDVDFSEDF